MSSAFFVSDPLGRLFNLAQAWEIHLRLEKKQYEGFNSATLVCKLPTGGIQLFYNQTLSTLIRDIMPGLRVNLFEGFYVETEGKFWSDPSRDAIRDTIQPVFKLVGSISGSKYRKLLMEDPEAAKWPLQDQILKANELTPDVMYVDNVPYLTILSLGQQLGVRFFRSEEDVFNLIEQANPDALRDHPQRHYIEKNIKMPFETERREKVKNNSSRLNLFKP